MRSAAVPVAFLVVGVVASLRGRARRRALDRCDPSGAAGRERGPDRCRRAVERVGRAARAATPGRRRWSGDPALDRRLGAAVLVGAVAAVLVHPALGPAGPLLVLSGEAWGRRRAASRARAELVDGLPDVVDLLVLAVAGGATVRGAVEAVARHGRGALADAFASVLDDVDRRGGRLADELGRLAAAVDPIAAPVLHPLVAAERYGVALGPSLALVARDLRQVRRHRAEEAIRRVPVKLVFPLVCCILPAFVVLTVVPLLVASFSQLHL